MPDIALKGHHSAGHDACPAVPAVEGSSTVHVAGRPVLRAGDAFAVHSCRDHPSHQGRIGQGAPHVRIGGKSVARKTDPITCGPATDSIVEGFSSVRVGNCGGDEYGREMAFRMLTLPMDHLILCLEEIAAAEYGRTSERDRQGWAYFREFMPKWLNRKAYIIQDKYDNGGQEPAFVDWDWLISFQRFYDASLEMQKEDYLFSSKAMTVLTRILDKDQAFEGEGTAFNHIALSWEKQREHAFQSYPMTLSKWTIWKAATGAFKWPPINPDGLQTTVANVTILALAAGRTFVGTKGEKLIRIEKVAFFIHDGFEFSGDQSLGWWDCENKRFLTFRGTELNNKAFRDFREHTGYGCDFRIMSPPQVVWTGEYWYDASS